MRMSALALSLPHSLKFEIHFTILTCLRSGIQLQVLGYPRASLDDINGRPTVMAQSNFLFWLFNGNH